MNPSLSTSPLGIEPQTRRAQANERSADAVMSLMEWAPASRPPAKDDFYAVRDKIEPGAATRHVVFTGGFWLSDTPPAAHRAIQRNNAMEAPFVPVSALAAQLIERVAAKPAAPLAKAKSFDELALEPMDFGGDESKQREIESLQKVSSLELKIEIVRFNRPAPNASGVSTGRVLAVSENFSAQDVGARGVVIHENANLDRKVAPGQAVTLSYDNGKATVFDGLFHDVRIDAPWMGKDQANYLRMVMLDALSMLKAPQHDDQRLKAALTFALQSTAEFFGVQETRLRAAEIQLSVNDVNMRPEAAAAVKPLAQTNPLAAMRSPRP